MKLALSLGALCHTKWHFANLMNKGNMHHTAVPLLPAFSYLITTLLSLSLSLTFLQLSSISVSLIYKKTGWAHHRRYILEWRTALLSLSLLLPLSLWDVYIKFRWVCKCHIVRQTILHSIPVICYLDIDTLLIIVYIYIYIYINLPYDILKCFTNTVGFTSIYI